MGGDSGRLSAARDLLIGQQRCQTRATRTLTADERERKVSGVWSGREEEGGILHNKVRSLLKVVCLEGVTVPQTDRA